MANLIYNFGLKLHPQKGSIHRIFPSPHNLNINSHSPKASNALFIAPSSHIRGNVIFEDQGIIMYNCFIECLSNEGHEELRIGSKSVIQDLVSVKARNGQSTVIGNNCYIGANSTIENSIIEDGVYVGPGCRIINSTLKKGAYLAPGTWVENGEVNENLVVCKRPFEVLREISFKETEYLQEKLKESFELTKIIATFHNQSLNVEDELISIAEFPDYSDDIDEFFEIDEYVKSLEELNLPSTESDLYFADYRDWMLSSMEERRQFSYKEDEFEPSRLENRPEEIFGAYHDNLEKQVELHEKSQQKKGKLIEPDFNFNKDDINFREEIQKRSDESNKF